MKRLLLSIILIFPLITCFAQDNEIMYFISLSKVVVDSEEQSDVNSGEYYNFRLIKDDSLFIMSTRTSRDWHHKKMVIYDISKPAVNLTAYKCVDFDKQILLIIIDDVNNEFRLIYTDESNGSFVSIIYDIKGVWE